MVDAMLCVYVREAEIWGGGPSPRASSEMCRGEGLETLDSSHPGPKSLTVFGLERLQTLRAVGRSGVGIQKPASPKSAGGPSSALALALQHSIPA